jgi:tetratricopeptide (TPR) repeat protein
MLEHLWSWLARSRGHPGHIAFGEARRLYLAYVQALRSPIDRLQAADFTAAHRDPGLLRAEALYRAAREHSAREGRSDNIAMADYQLGLLLHLQGRWTEARDHLQLAVEWLRAGVTAASHERSTLSGCFYHLGLLAMRLGDRGEAERLLRASLAIDEDDSDFGGIALCKSALETLASWPFDIVPPGENSSAAPAVPPLAEAAPQPPALDDLAEDAPASGIRGRDWRAEIAEEPEVEEGDSVASTSTIVVWLLSYSVEANEVYMAALERQLARGVVGRVLVRRAALGSTDPAQSILPRLEPEERLCAALLVLEEEGLHHRVYLDWAAQCLQRVAGGEDFRLFAGAPQPGRAVSEYERAAGTRGKGILEELADTVQLVGAGSASRAASGSTPSPIPVPSPDEVCAACWAYLRQAEAVRAAALWRRVRMVMARSAGRLAYCAQVAAALLVGLAALAGLALGPGSTLSQLVASHLEAVACLAGIVWFPVNTLPAYYLLRGLRAMARMPQERPDLVRLFVRFLPASLGIGFLIDRLRLPVSWFVLSIAAGGLIDHVRRVGVQGRRAGVSLRQCWQLRGEDGIAAALLIRGANLVEHPMQVSLFPALRPRVFVSYARDTRWSAPMAHRLHRLLADQGTVSFIDWQGIGPGSSWWPVLNRSLGKTDVFVSLLDAEATTRPMVAAELLAALAARAQSGTPRLLILAGPDLDARNRRESLPVFEAVLADSPLPASHRQVRIIPASEGTLRTVASGLRPAHYETTSVVPGEWAALLQFLAVPIVSLGAMTEIAGPGAGVLALLEHWQRTQVAAFLDGWHLLGPACLLAGYLAGFAARLVASKAFEVGGVRRGLGPYGVYAFSCVGASALALGWANYLSPLLLGWVVVLAGTGWCLAEVFLGTVRREKPGIFGPE